MHQNTTHLERIEKHFKVEFHQFRFVTDAVRQTDEDHVMDAKQRNQDQCGFSQLPVRIQNFY